MKAMIAADNWELVREVRSRLHDIESDILEASSLRQAYTIWKGNALDVIFLSRSLSGGSADELCREIRNRSRGVQVYMLEDMGTGHQLDENLRSVLERITDIRRSGKKQPVVVGDLYLDFEHHEFRRKQEQLSLTPTEIRVLKQLLDRRGEIVSKKVLMEQGWNGRPVDGNTLSIAVRRLRGKLEDNPKKPRYIQTVYSVGYQWQDI